MIDLKALKATLELLETEKNIPREKVIEAIEFALAAAFKKDYGKKGQVIRCTFNQETGEMDFVQVKTVVDDSTVRPALTAADLEAMKEGTFVEDEPSEDGVEPLPRFDQEKHINIADAKKIKGGVELEDEIVFPLETPDGFGRIAAQTAKQVIISRIKDAERETVAHEYHAKIGDILHGVITKYDRGTVYIEFPRALGILARDEQIPGEFYKPGQRIKAYLQDVENSYKGVLLKLSRSHPLFVESLFTLESPEVAGGIVEIKSIAREPGSRSKIAVSSNDPAIDPVGSCIGQRGSRVSSITAELNGEKIDIIPWSADATEFIANSLAPAQVLSVTIEEENHLAHIDVAEDQLSLAIGKGGQNVRLAVKLTGWRIDINGITPDDNSITELVDSLIKTEDSEEAEAADEESEDDK